MTGEQPQAEQSPADRYLYAELALAEEEDRNIGDTAARLIAMGFHGGQSSALYSLGSSGAVDYDRLSHEIWTDYNAEDVTDDARRKLDHLSTYAIEHQGRGRVEGWFALTDDRRIERLLGEVGLI